MAKQILKDCANDEDDIPESIIVEMKRQENVDNRILIRYRLPNTLFGGIQELSILDDKPNTYDTYTRRNGDTVVRIFMNERDEAKLAKKLGLKYDSIVNKSNEQAKIAEIKDGAQKMKEREWSRDLMNKAGELDRLKNIGGTKQKDKQFAASRGEQDGT